MTVKRNDSRVQLHLIQFSSCCLRWMSLSCTKRKEHALLDFVLHVSSILIGISDPRFLDMDLWNPYQRNNAKARGSRRSRAIRRLHRIINNNSQENIRHKMMNLLPNNTFQYYVQTMPQQSSPNAPGLQGGCSKIFKQPSSPFSIEASRL